MKFISVKCPECAANLSISEDREYCFCEYCGTKILRVDENSYSHTYTRIDKAELIRAETERIIALNKIKADEVERKHRNRKEIVSIIGEILLFPFKIVKGILGFMGPLLKILFKIAIVLVLLFLVFIGIMGIMEGPEELGLVGLGAAFVLLLMWEHRKKGKE